MQTSKKAAAVSPSQWTVIQEENKRLILSDEFKYPIAYTSQGTPYMDVQNLEETGNREEIKLDMPATDKDGKQCNFKVEITLAEYKYTPVKGDPVKLWFTVATDQKSLIKLLESNLQIQKLAFAMKNYVDITLATNPAILNSGIPEIGLSHALSLTGDEFTKEIEEIMFANLRGSMSPTEATKEIQSLSSRIITNYINSQHICIYSKRYMKAIDDLLKLLKERNIDLLGTYSMLPRQTVLNKTSMEPVVVSGKINPDVVAIESGKRSERANGNRITLI